ncbi:MAG: hypothetical protein OHK0017_00400 [Patescibacteria group bacterium]
MQTISQVVWNIVSVNQIALDYLKTGLLNTSAYAKLIQPQVEKELMLNVSANSIVTALSRIRQNQVISNQSPKFIIRDLSFKLPISELVFKKNGNPHPDLADIYSKLSKESDIHLNIVNVEEELDIFVSSSKVDVVKKCLAELNLLCEENKLSALMLKYDPSYRQYSGMASQILNSLAVNSITMVECLTTYSEFIIYIKQDQANRAIDLLTKEFMN